MSGLRVQDISHYKPDFGDILGAENHKTLKTCEDRLNFLESRYKDYAAMRSWLNFIGMEANVSEVNSWIDRDSREWQHLKSIYKRLDRIGADLTRFYGSKVFVIYGVKLTSGPPNDLNIVEYRFKRPD